MLLIDMRHCVDSAGKGKEMHFLGKIFVLHEYSACSLPAGN